MVGVGKKRFLQHEDFDQKLKRATVVILQTTRYQRMLPGRDTSRILGEWKAADALVVHLRPHWNSLAHVTGVGMEPKPN